jgi:hypothetical protein
LFAQYNKGIRKHCSWKHHLQTGRDNNVRNMWFERLENLEGKYLKFAIGRKYGVDGVLVEWLRKEVS